MPAAEERTASLDIDYHPLFPSHFPHCYDKNENDDNEKEIFRSKLHFHFIEIEFVSFNMNGIICFSC